MVTLYATLGDDAIAHGINETQASVVVTTQDLLPKFRQILQDCPCVKLLIYVQDQLALRGATPPGLAVNEGFREDVKIVTFNDVVHSGAQATHIRE